MHFPLLMHFPQLLEVLQSHHWPGYEWIEKVLFPLWKVLWSFEEHGREAVVHWELGLRQT